MILSQFLNGVSHNLPCEVASRVDGDKIAVDTRILDPHGGDPTLATCARMTPNEARRFALRVMEQATAIDRAREQADKAPPLVRGSRDADAFLESERARLDREWTRDALIAWLAWNDPNGTYRDADMDEDHDPLTKEECLDLIMEHVNETLESPEAMRKGSRR